MRKLLYILAFIPVLSFGQWQKKVTGDTLDLWNKQPVLRYNDNIVADRPWVLAQTGAAAPGNNTEIILNSSGNFGTNANFTYTGSLFSLTGETKITHATTPTISLYTGVTKRATILATSNHLNFYSFASKPILFSIDSVEKLRIASNGNIGINYNNPTIKLHIRGNTDSTDSETVCQFESKEGLSALSFTKATGTYNWDIQALHQGYDYSDLILNGTGGKVGIGGAPVAKLHVYTPDLVDADSLTEGLSVSRAHYPDQQAIFNYYGGTLNIIAHDANNNTGYIDLKTWNGSNDVSRLFINTDGNVGIGDIVPSFPLTVNGAAQVGYAGVSTNSTKFYLENQHGKKWALSSGLNNVSENSFGIYNWTADGGETTPVAKLAIQSDGNVSINQNIATYKLDVNGDVNIANGSHYKVNGVNVWDSAKITAAIHDSITTSAPAYGFMTALTSSGGFDGVPMTMASGTLTSTKLVAAKGDSGLYIASGGAGTYNIDITCYGLFYPNTNPCTMTIKIYKNSTFITGFENIILHTASLGINQSYTIPMNWQMTLSENDYITIRTKATAGAVDGSYVPVVTLRLTRN